MGHQKYEVDALFQDPPAKFRGAPFWSWNCELDKEQIVKQVEYFKEMGMGGFHIHARTGLDTPYLGEQFMDAVKASIEKAKQENLLVYLYDEDRWPSGFAGGMVTKEESFRGRHLVLKPRSGDTRVYDPERSSNERTLILSYDITLEDGYLTSWRILGKGEEGENVWDLYLEFRPKLPWFNYESYVDVMNPEAIKRFIETTHELYYREIGEEFGSVVPSIFTDEAQLTANTFLGFADGKEGVTFPFTDKLSELYMERYGDDFFNDIFPQLVWELPDGKGSTAKYRYRDLVAEMFVTAFADTIGEWCKEHGITMTGHMKSEDTLHAQTAELGEAMRFYRSFGLPGIDVLCDDRVYSTAKQAQSAAHQYGREGVMSELYGATNWDLDFRRHKLGGDWQAALGVTLRVHHLAWMSMAGAAKRDWPASIFYQSPWYKEYALIEDHFARVNVAMTSGKPRVRIGVIHPLETFWLYTGPNEQTKTIRDELERNFQNVIEWLLFEQLDFDFISESLLKDQYVESSDRKFHVGEMSYDVVLVPGCNTIRSTTLSALRKFREAEGDVIFAGEAPTYVDACISEEGSLFADVCTCVTFSKNRIVRALDQYRDIEVRKPDGTTANSIIYQMREIEDDGRFVFLVNGRKIANEDLIKSELLTVSIPGVWQVTHYDTLNGTTKEIKPDYGKNSTVFKWRMHEEDSLLLKLERNDEACVKTCPAEIVDAAKGADWEKVLTIVNHVNYSLSEPNVLVLDMAEYRLNGGEWQPVEELLRMDNKLRRQLGMLVRHERVAQPFANPKGKLEHVLELRFKVDLEAGLDEMYLALEQPEMTEIFVNGIKIEKKDCGYYVDESIRKIALMPVLAGELDIHVNIAYADYFNVENMYLLGDFGVKVVGNKAEIIRLPEKLGFSDICSQGLPFYGGNALYECEFEVKEAGEYEIGVTKFRAPLIGVSVDGSRTGTIAFSPYRASLGYLEKGKHTISLEVFGNRINTFGQLHLSDEKLRWYGDGSWKTVNESFSYQYQLKKMGILREPEIFKRKME
ncbi:glycosyl hydrolase [Paenibacillus sp. LHD-38]|uniref:glycosyl hydrolase n=1 Tax=Paenibacillus sp. LHD-38 TaxID=3072143 RepID=UPI00280DFF0C|nr:glycosyl hydrolase [Paenibacillus sp. LHD-38]MDQ8737904.1 glycosyl hydrolase [Paenibacillus sp. LHD-38]